MKESLIQTQAVQWFRMQYKDKIIFSIPNGAYFAGNWGQIAKLKREGMLSGVPDVCIPHPKGSHGLFIEMKSKTGVLSKEQKAVQKILSDEGYAVKIARSLEEFMAIVKEYFCE